MACYLLTICKDCSIIKLSTHTSSYQGLTPLVSNQSTTWPSILLDDDSSVVSQNIRSAFRQNISSYHLGIL